MNVDKNDVNLITTYHINNSKKCYNFNITH